MRFTFNETHLNCPSYNILSEITKNTGYWGTVYLGVFNDAS